MLDAQKEQKIQQILCHAEDKQQKSSILSRKQREALAGGKKEPGWVLLTCIGFQCEEDFKVVN